MNKLLPGSSTLAAIGLSTSGLTSTSSSFIPIPRLALRPTPPLTTRGFFPTPPITGAALATAFALAPAPIAIAAFTPGAFAFSATNGTPEPEGPRLRDSPCRDWRYDTNEGGPDGGEERWAAGGCGGGECPPSDGCIDGTIGVATRPLLLNCDWGDCDGGSNGGGCGGWVRELWRDRAADTEAYAAASCSPDT